MAVDNKNLIDEDDDFTFGTKDLKTGKENEKVDETTDSKDEEKEKTNDQSKEEEEKKDEKEEKEKTDEVTDEVDDELPKDEKKDDKEKEDKKKYDKEEDLFVDEVDEAKEKNRKRTLKEIGKKFDLDLTADDDDEEFEIKLSDKLSKSRQEVNLDGFSDDAKALIKHLNLNGGDVESFFTNKNIIGLQSVLSLDAETKVRNVRLNELTSDGLSKKEAMEKIDEEFSQSSTREIKDLADDIDQQAKKLIQTEVKKMVGDKEIKAAVLRQQEEAKVVADRVKLKGYIEKQENFLGLKLSPEAKKAIVRYIENGEFDKLLNTNPEQQKFAAYMLGKHGAKILKKIDSTISESNRKGYNTALKKSVDALHKTDDDVAVKKSGHQPGRKQEQGKRPRFDSADIE